MMDVMTTIMERRARASKVAARFLRVEGASLRCWFMFMVARKGPC